MTKAKIKLEAKKKCGGKCNITVRICGTQHQCCSSDSHTFLFLSTAHQFRKVDHLLATFYFIIINTMVELMPQSLPQNDHYAQLLKPVRQLTCQMKLDLHYLVVSLHHPFTEFQGGVRSPLPPFYRNFGEGHGACPRLRFPPLDPHMENCNAILDFCCLLTKG